VSDDLDFSFFLNPDFSQLGVINALVLLMYQFDLMLDVARLNISEFCSTPQATADSTNAIRGIYT
jgi:hypothetical protein